MSWLSDAFDWTGGLFGDETLGSDLGDWFNNIGSGAIPTSSDKQSNGKWDSSLLGSILQGGTGLAGIYANSQASKDALEQQNKQWEDQFNYNKETRDLNNALRAQEIAAQMAAVGAQKKRTIADAYANYVNSLNRQQANTIEGYKNLGSAMASPLVNRDRRGY